MVTAILVTAILLTSMNERTEPNNFIRSNEYEILVRYYLIQFVVRSKLVRSVVRNFGSKLSCAVRVQTLGPLFLNWKEMIRFVLTSMMAAVQRCHTELLC